MIMSAYGKTDFVVDDEYRRLRSRSRSASTANALKLAQSTPYSTGPSLYVL